MIRSYLQQGMYMAWALVALGACGNVQEKPAIDAATSDEDASIQADAATECAIGVQAMCDGTNLLTCDGQGNITATIPCSLGCDPVGARCKEIDPSNGLAAALDESAGAADLVLTGNAVIDTDAGTITDTTGMKTVLTQTLSAGLPVPVFVVKAKSITTGAVRVVGTKALALVADGPITFDGRVSVDANADVPGPGAITNQPACTGGTSGAGTADGYPGGGGGGFGSPGGKGGDAVGQIGGAGGGVVGNVELVPLRGGCSGGEGRAGTPDVDPMAPDPGAGGGALQVVSNTSITLGAGAFVSANGGGGRHLACRLLASRSARVDWVRVAAPAGRFYWRLRSSRSTQQVASLLTVELGPATAWSKRRPAT